MNVPVKAKPDDTRARIIETADALFRRLGFAKTAVADIAAELGMSPANVYRFFPSKNAIVEAICRRCLPQVEENAWAVARSRGPAAARMERLVLDILKYHKDNLLTDKRVNDIVLIAIEDSWDAIQAHKEVIRNAFEMILRDGIESGEFEPVDPHETSAPDDAVAGRLHAPDPDLAMPQRRRGHGGRSPRRRPLPAARRHPPELIPMPTRSTRTFARLTTDDRAISSVITSQ